MCPLTYVCASFYIGVSAADDEYDAFVTKVMGFCVSNVKCELPSFRIGASYC